MSFLSAGARARARALWLPSLHALDPAFKSAKWVVLGDGATGAVFLNEGSDRVYKIWRRARLAGIRECTVGTYVQRVNAAAFAGFENYWQIGDTFVGASANHGAVDLYSLVDVISPALLAHYMRQLVHVVAELHAMSILHNDIKLENILVAPDNTVRLTDWGCASFGEGGCGGGTVPYNHPRVAGRAERTRTTDYYALLVTMFTACERPKVVYNDMARYEKALLRAPAPYFDMMAYALGKLRLMHAHPAAEYDIKDGLLRQLSYYDDGVPATRPNYLERALGRPGRGGALPRPPADGRVHPEVAEDARARHSA